MIGEHHTPTPAERDDGRVTDNAQRVAAHIAQALRDAGYSCAVLNLPPSPHNSYSRQAIGFAHERGEQ
jgi:hypothetical protein